MILHVLKIRKLTMALLLVGTTATMAQVPKEKEAAAKVAGRPKYNSAQAVGNAFLVATAKKDWKTSYHCFAPDARDMVVVHLITMTRFASTGKNDDKRRAALEKVFKKHTFDPQKAAAKVEETANAAEKEKKPQDWRKVVKTYVESIKDKETFFEDLLKWADEYYAGEPDVRPSKAVLQDIQSTQETAEARVSDDSREGWKIGFKKMDGGWFLDVGKGEYEPGGWDDGFLFDYLDSIHHWQF
jgi:hypothetical protein